MTATQENAPKSIMGIVGLVFAIVAAASSFMPIINNISFFVALVSAVLSAIALLACLKGKKSGKGIAIAGIVVSVASIAIVMMTQSAYSAAIDDAVKGPDVANVSQGGEPQAKDDSKSADGTADYVDLKVGSTVELESGLSVTVDSVDASLVNYDGSPIVGVQVTYANGSDASADFNTYDWKGEDSQGARENVVYYSEADNELGSGSLAAGGTKTGMLYFKEGTVKALYFASILSDEESASWQIAS